MHWLSKRTLNLDPQLAGDLIVAWVFATVLSGLPSTLYAIVMGIDAMEPTRAAGAMLISADAPLPALLVAAFVVHCSVSLFWATVLTVFLPRRHVILGALLASAAIAVLDLRIIGRFFPEIYALPFWPQFADHLMWGLCVGVVLAYRSKQRAEA